MSKQKPLDTFRAMLQYTDRNEDYRSNEVYKPPRRTSSNGWVKLHANPKHDCGSNNVRFIERQGRSALSEKFEYDLYCMSCGHRVDETDVLFIGGDWYSDNGWETYGRPIEDVNMPDERVLELGTNPTEDALRHALTITRIESEATLHGLTFGTETYEECRDCNHETPLLFDNRCRMCYDGEWTPRMTDTLIAAEDCIRKRNNSFAHQVEDKINPVSIKNRAFTGKILWRRHSNEGTTKLVEVLQCLQDDDDGHWEYILTDLTRTTTWRYPQTELTDCFWDTGLYNDTPGKPVTDERLTELHNKHTK